MSQDVLPLSQQDDDHSECSLALEYSALWSVEASPPDLIAFLKSRTNVNVEQRAKLILLDQARTWSIGQGRSVEDYLLCWPELAAERTLLLKLLVREYQFRDSPPVTGFVDRFPDLRTELLEQLCSDDDERTSGHVSNSAMSSLFEETALSGLDEVGSDHETIHDLSNVEPLASRNPPLTAPVVAPFQKPQAPGHHLRESFPFNSLPASLVDELESHMQEQTFAQGAALIRQGDPGSSLILIRDGSADIDVTDELGVTHTIDRSGSGDVLGEMSLLTEEPRSASVIARQTTRAGILPAAVFHEYAKRNPEISQVLTKLLAERLGSSRRDVLAGRTLDCFRVLRRLGKGGMSVVYEGIEHGTGKKVALKMLSHRLVYDAESLKWFQREADLIESFEHPNIVRMFGRFQAFHSFFIVMEFCDGITLERLLRLSGPLSFDNFRKAFGQLASAVHFAHERNVLHRDIKPVNLMLNFDGMLKLMDFGLAIPLSTDQAEMKQRTHIVGTPRYMAPEQLRGRELTKAADYFALGSTAYKLLTGSTLFAEADAVTIREIHARWKVPDFATTHPNFPPDICELLTGCLQRRPEKRLCDLAKYAEWAAPLDVTELL